MANKETLIDPTIWKCLRCGHVWANRMKRRPRICPNCKSYLWDFPKKSAAIGEKMKPKSKPKKVKQTGIFTSKEAALNAQRYWKRQGYGARIREVQSDYYTIDLYK